MNGGIQIGNSDRGIKRLYRMTKEWDQSSSTWQSLGGGVSTWSGNNIATSNNGLANVWEDYDVTETIQKFINGELENYGFCMGYRLDDFGCYYFSSEHADTQKRPKLTIEYNPTDIQKNFSYSKSTISFQSLNNSIKIDFNENYYSIKILNAMGNTIKSFENKKSIKIFKNNIPNGVYFIKFTNNKISQAKKIVISK